MNKMGVGGKVFIEYLHETVPITLAFYYEILNYRVPVFFKPLTSILP
jgi:hypothetical protein